MSEDTDQPGPAQPVVKKKQGVSIVWLIPLVTALVGGWLVYKTLTERGPQITITFKTAEGIEAGKTKVKYKNIEVGVVAGLEFSEDLRNVMVRVDMAKDTRVFLRRNTRFWVVKPRLGLRGVSGLSTLITGAYIELEPGQGAFQRHFAGLDVPPVVKAEEEGVKVVLLSDNLGSLDTGSPVYYQGLLAGEVLGYELGNDQNSVFIHVFIKAPYHDLVRGNTRFWNVSGMDVNIDSEGIDVRTESMKAVLFGGIAFETPNALEPVKEDIQGLVFTLYDDHESIEETSFTRKLLFVMFFEGSVRGLNIGAPVEFKGIKIGTVKDIRLEFDRRDTSFRIPVLVEIEPERVIATGDEGSTPLDTLNTLVERGLRARLQTGSLLTGQLFIELDMHPRTPVHLVDADIPYPELPTIPAALEQITESVKSFLAKVEGLDLDALARELQGTLEGTNRIVNSRELTSAVQGADRVINSEELLSAVKGADKLMNAPELHRATRDLQRSLKTLRSILEKVDTRVEPLSAEVGQAAAAGREALEKVQVTLGLMDRVLESDSPLQYRYIEMAEELSETARSIRAFMDLMERHPQSILFGKRAPGED